MLDFLSDYTRLREQNKDCEPPPGTGLIQGFQPSRGLKSAFEVSSIFVPFTLLLQVSDRMHLVDSGQTVAVWRWHRSGDVSGTQGHPIPISTVVNVSSSWKDTHKEGNRIMNFTFARFVLAYKIQLNRPILNLSQQDQPHSVDREYVARSWNTLHRPLYKQCSASLMMKQTGVSRLVLLLA